MWLDLMLWPIYLYNLSFELFVCNYILPLIFIQKPVASGMFGYPETSQP